MDAAPVFRAGALAILGEAGLPARGLEPASLGQLVTLSGARSALLLDASLGTEPCAWDVVARLHAAAPSTLGVVVVTDRLLAAGMLEALDAGALALVHRRCTPDELLTAVTSALAGTTWVSPPIAELLRSEARRRSAGTAPQPLSPREHEVLRRLATGATNAAIGRALGISEHTVRNHVRAILAKLGVANRTDAVTTALRRGLVDLTG